MLPADVHSLAGAYALHALSDAEQAQFEQHLAECAMCGLEVAELRETAARLADDAAVAPPPHLRSSVIAKIHRVSQELPQVARHRPPSPRRKPVQAWRHRAVQLVAAALLVIASVAGTVLFLNEDHSRHSPIAMVIDAPDATVRSQPVRNGGTLTTISSAQRGQTVVMLSDAAKVGDDKAYQLWLIEGTGKPVSAGVLAAGSTRDTRVLNTPSADTVALSVEPASGSASPTTVVASVQLR